MTKYPINSTIAEILVDERWYNDCPPSWLGAPTADDARDQRRSLVKRLRRFASAFQGAAIAADRLDTCRPHNRCASGQCPECLRAGQRLFVDILHRETIVSKDGPSVALSLMSPTWQALFDDLQSLNVGSIKNELVETLGRAGNFTWFGLGMDVSLNDDTQKGLGVFWQLQFYGIVGANDRRRFAKSLREAFHATCERVTRPVRVVACDDSAKALSYALKTSFVRRVSYRGDGVTRTGQLRECWRTRKISLRAKEEIALRLWLDGIELKSEFFLRLGRQGKNVIGRNYLKSHAASTSGMPTKLLMIKTPVQPVRERRNTACTPSQGHKHEHER